MPGPTLEADNDPPPKIVEIMRHERASTLAQRITGFALGGFRRSMHRRTEIPLQGASTSALQKGLRWFRYDGGQQDFPIDEWAQVVINNAIGHQVPSNTWDCLPKNPVRIAPVSPWSAAADSVARRGDGRTIGTVLKFKRRFRLNPHEN